MKSIAKFGTWLCLGAGLAFGMTNYHGQLMDASCYTQRADHSGKAWVACAPTASTTNFAIHTNGKVRMLNPAGNQKAEAAMQKGILKHDANGDMPVVVAGTRHGNMIRVESIRARGSETAVH